MLLEMGTHLLLLMSVDGTKYSQRRYIGFRVYFSSPIGQSVRSNFHRSMHRMYTLTPYSEHIYSITHVFKGMPLL